jgi:hypothetical protein
MKNKHISYDKLSKKKQRQIDRLKRGTWYGVNPVTRAPKSSKAYDRRKAQDWKKDSGPVFLSLIAAETQSGRYHTGAP